MHTPLLKDPGVLTERFCKVLKTFPKAGDLDFFFKLVLLFFTNWFIVGMPFLSASGASGYKNEHPAPILGKNVNSKYY